MPWRRRRRRRLTWQWKCFESNSSPARARAQPGWFHRPPPDLLLPLLLLYNARSLCQRTRLVDFLSSHECEMQIAPSQNRLGIVGHVWVCTKNVIREISEKENPAAQLRRKRNLGKSPRPKEVNHCWKKISVWLLFFFFFCLSTQLHLGFSASVSYYSLRCFNFRHLFSIFAISMSSLKVSGIVLSALLTAICLPCKK